MNSSLTYPLQISPGALSSENILQNLSVRPASRQVYRAGLKSFQDFLNSTGRQGDRQGIVAFKEHLQSRGLQPATINSYLTAVKMVYREMSAETGVPSPAEGIRGARRARGYRKGHLEPDQVELLLDCAKAQSLRDFTILSVMVRALLRTIEVARLNVEDYTWRNGRRIVRVWGKGHDTRDNYVLVSDKLRDCLDEYLRQRGCLDPQAPLFVSESRHNRGERMSTRSLRRICGHYLQEIGIADPAITTHSLRHTGAVWLLEGGASILDVQAVLRHESVKTTEVYLESIRDRRRLEQGTEQLLDRIY